MKEFKINIQDKEIIVFQDDDGCFIKPEIVIELEKQGTATKPAHEPICMARKPLSEKTVAENCLKWGTGGINIDDSRVEGSESTIRPAGVSKSDRNAYGKYRADEGNGREFFGSNTGRFPANLIHDNSEEVRECFPETGKGAIPKGKFTIDSKNGIYGKFGERENTERIEFDSGNASRFFKSIIYQAKPSKKERNAGCEGLEDVDNHGHYAQDEWSRNNMGNTPDAKREPIKNNHPTVKPIALMEYLIKMVTPKDGVVLDPFMGSGTTGCASIKNGFDFIGIDLEEEYIKIATARINYYKVF